MFASYALPSDEEKLLLISFSIVLFLTSLPSHAALTFEGILTFVNKTEKQKYLWSLFFRVSFVDSEDSNWQHGLHARRPLRLLCWFFRKHFRRKFQSRWKLAEKFYQVRSWNFPRWWKHGNSFKVNVKCLFIRLIRQSSSSSSLSAFHINNSAQISLESLRTLSATLISPASRVDGRWAEVRKRFSLSLPSLVNPFTQPLAPCQLYHSLIFHGGPPPLYLSGNLHLATITETFIINLLSCLRSFLPSSEIRWADERRASKA